MKRYLLSWTHGQGLTTNITFDCNNIDEAIIEVLRINGEYLNIVSYNIKEVDTGFEIKIPKKGSTNGYNPIN